MATGVVPGLQSRCGASRRPGWVRFPHVPAIFAALLALAAASAAPGPGSLAAQTPDSVRAATPAPADSVPEVPDPTSARAAADTLPPVSAFGAFGRSLLLPGWGQTAVDRPARGAIYFTLEAATLFMLFRSQARLSAARRAEPPDEELLERRRGAREDWIVASIFVAFASGLDAWVSARFWDFEAEVEPPEEAGVGLALRLELPLRLP